MKKTPNNIIKGFFHKKQEYNILDIYHGFMVTYGYINFNEFKKMDAWLMSELVARINKDNEKGNSGGRKFR